MLCGFSRDLAGEGAGGQGKGVWGREIWGFRISDEKLMYLCMKGKHKSLLKKRK